MASNSQLVQCLALRTVKYNDSSSIITLWTRQLGRISAVVPDGSGREARRRRAIMMPMGIFEAVVKLKPGRSIATLSDVRPLCGVGLPNPAASVVAMFLADFLYTALKEESQPDGPMADFLFANAELLPTLSGSRLANFHLSFLYRLGHFLGVEPDMGTYAPGRYFDLKEGIYTVSAPTHPQYLQGEAAQIPWILSRLRPRTLGLLRLSHKQRNAVLDGIIDYYSLHYARLSALSSLPIVREIFS